MILTILIFIIILGILVLVHEFGHFIVAKKSGMVVHEFGFGFPPRLVGVKKVQGSWKVVWGHQKSLTDQELNHGDENTLYSINTIPLGGFVRIKGENNEYAEDPKSFINKGFWPRFFTLVAGVVMNWLLAAVILSTAAFVGTDTELSGNLPASAKISNRRVIVEQVLPNSPAEKAGLEPLDFIVEIDGQKYSNIDQVRDYLYANKGKEFKITVQRRSEQKTFIVSSLANPGPKEGPTGIGLVNVGKVSMPFFSAVYAGFSEAVSITKTIYVQLGSLFKSREVVQSIGGPVAIGKLVGEARLMGVVTLLRLSALLSLSLAIINILPFPALDGGRVLFLIIEKIRGKKNNQKIEQFANAAGFAFLLLLMVLVTIKDLIKG